MTPYLLLAAIPVYLTAIVMHRSYTRGLARMRRDFEASFPGRCFDCSRRRFFLETVVVHVGCLESTIAGVSA